MPDEGGAHELVVLDHEHTCHAPHRTPNRRAGSGACGQLRRDRSRTATGDTWGRVRQYGRRCAEDSYTLLAWTLATGAAVTLSWWGVHTVMTGTAYDPPRAAPRHGGRRGRAEADRPDAGTPSPASREPRHTPDSRRHADPDRVTHADSRPRAADPLDPAPLRQREGVRHRRRAGRSSTSATDYATLVSATPGGGLVDAGVEDGDLDPGGVHCGRGPGLGVLHLARRRRRAWRSYDLLNRCRSASVARGPPGSSAEHRRRRRGRGHRRRVRDRHGSAGEVDERAAVFDPGRVRVARGAAGQLGDRAAGGRRPTSTALPKRLPRSTVGSAISASSGKTSRGGGDLAAQMRERRPVGEVGGVAAAGRSRPCVRRSGTRPLVRWAGVRAPLNTSAMTRSAQPSGDLREPFAGVGGAHPDPGLRVQRQLAAHQLDERRVALDDLLGGAGPGRGHVAGEGEGAAAEVQDLHGLAGRGDEVDRRGRAGAGTRSRGTPGRRGRRGTAGRRRRAASTRAAGPGRAAARRARRRPPRRRPRASVPRPPVPCLSPFALIAGAGR